MEYGIVHTFSNRRQCGRQFVSWDVWLIPVTNATLALCFKCHRGLPEIIGRKARMTPNQHGPLMTWAAHVVQWPVQCVRCRKAEINRNKAGLSSDWGLKPALMKLESLVIANQLCGDEYVPEACTHRPSRQASWEQPKHPFTGSKLDSVRGTKS